MGEVVDANGIHGVLYSSGTFSTIDYTGSACTGACVTELFDINGTGQIVGWGNGTAFLYEGGIFTPLAYPGATNTFIYGINDAGEMVGTYSTAPPVPEPSGLILFIMGFSIFAGTRLSRMRRLN